MFRPFTYRGHFYGVTKIPIAYNVQGTHTDFPLYLKPSAISGLGALTQAQAASVRMYADARKMQELPREVVGADELHVKVPSLDSATAIYLDYNGQRPDYAVTDTFGAQAVWNSSYRLVSHDGGSTDSTLNVNNGTPHSAGGISQVSGKLGSAASFDGSSCFETPVIDFGSGKTITLSAWAYFRDSSKVGILIEKSSDINLANAGIYMAVSDSVYPRDLAVSGHGNNGYSLAQANQPVNDNAWVKTTATWDITKTSQEVASLVNGVDMSSMRPKSGGGFYNANNTNTLGSDRFYIGARDLGDFGIIGYLDEIRIADVILSDDWIATEYANQNDPATFFGTAVRV